MNLKPRGTALIFKEGRVLLVRDKGKRRFMLPGGGRHDQREPAIATACREIGEEMDLHPIRAERRPNWDFETKNYHHQVVLIAVDNEPQVVEEIEEFIWWDMEEVIDRHYHVDAILEKYLFE